MPEVPKDITPLFMATKSQEIFGCICDEDVTEENPCKVIAKEAILEDFLNRAAISDFHPVKQIVKDYPGDEILIVYDPDFAYGQNFFMCLTEEAKERFVSPAAAEGEAEGGGEGGAEGGAEDAEDTTVYEYKPPESKVWEHLGSQAEIQDEVIVETREKIRFRASRVRREFGAPISFSDRDADIQATDQGLSASYLSCQPYSEANFSIKKLEMDRAVQAVAEITDGSSQTQWKHPVNASIQYEPRSITETEAKEIEATSEYAAFIENAAPRFELALQQNTIMDVFFDDWGVLGVDDSNFGSKSDSHLKEYQSFTDLQYSKDKTVTCIDWHPTIRGVMAVACCERLTYAERVDNANRLLMTPSLILIWSFADPIHPQILLEGPDDISCFKFNPTNPNIIAGGCINGQLVLWDITEFESKLSSSHRGSHVNPSAKKKAMFGEEISPEIPTVRYCAVSGIENSHRSIITSINWVADHYEFSRTGAPVENRYCESCQIITCGTDGNVMVWDTRPPKVTTTNKDQDKLNFTPLGVSQTFKYLDLTWKPLIKNSMAKADSSGDYSPMRISLPEKQGHRDHVPFPEGVTQRGDGTGMTKASSAKVQKALDNVSTKYFIGTEDGEVVYCDFKMEKDNESGKQQVPKPSWSVSPHYGAVNTLQRNPIFNDILLSVGGWTFAIWKEGVTSAAILQSACTAKLYTSGHWSTTRPAVFFLGTKDGNVEVWDLLDRTHEPILTQNVTAAEVTQIVPWVVSKKQHLLAVSDNAGTLHILEIPWNLRQPSGSEKASIENYFDRETQRIEYFQERAMMRESQRADAEAAKNKPAAAKGGENLEELEEQYKEEYNSYLELEKKLLIELGVLEAEEED